MRKFSVFLMFWNLLYITTGWEKVIFVSFLSNLVKVRSLILQYIFYSIFQKIKNLILQMYLLAHQLFMASNYAIKSTISFGETAHQRVAGRLQIWHGLLTTWSWVKIILAWKIFWVGKFLVFFLFFVCKVAENLCIHHNCSYNIIFLLGRGNFFCWITAWNVSHEGKTMWN